MFLKIMISLCVLLALALLIPRGRPVPPSVAKVDPLLAKSGIAYLYPAEYYPLGSIEEDYEGPVDSVEIPNAELTATLEILLNGLHYDSPEYEYYQTGVLPEMYDMAGCHYPRFILAFRDKNRQVSNYFSICFECGNAQFSNGVRYPKGGSYGMSVEGLVAFRNLQDRLFPAYKGTFFWDPTYRFRK